MEGATFAATIEVLVQNNENMINDFKNDSPIREEDAKQLQETLAITRSYLNDAEKKSITQHAVEIWLRKLEAVAFNADNVLDELYYHHLRNKVNKKMPSKEKVLSCFSSFHHTARPRNMALRIKKINADFESMNKRAADLGLQIENAPTAAARNASINETISVTRDPIFIGRDDDVEKLVEKITHVPEGQKFSTVAIVGMGGLGKTTLSRKVFNHKNVQDRFDSRIWIHVSGTDDPTMLFKRMLSVLTAQTYDRAERESILQELEQALNARTYLLVLDDIWDEDLCEYLIYIIAKVTFTRGNAIIITTRIPRVASVVRRIHIHPLHGLSDKDSWSIIKEKALNGDVSSEKEMIGKEIAKRCCGVPLAANLVGGVLSRSKSTKEWGFIKDRLLSDVDDRGGMMSKILELSFDYLPSPSIKICFAYCSIFSEGERILKQELIEMWMAEGFLHERNNMETLGSKFVDVLVHSSLLLDVGRDEQGHGESFVMHDVVHDFASCVLRHLPGRYMFDKGRYMFDKDSSIRKQHLRTLIWEDEISDITFSDFESLHVLIIKNYEVRELPSSIRKLIHLRNLNISNTSIRELPEWIAELHHLQTLRADTGYFWKLPKTFKDLNKLRYLYINPDVYINRDEEIPAETSESHLDVKGEKRLNRVKVGDNEGCWFEELGSLKYLKGDLEICNLEKVKGMEEANKAKIGEKPYLRDLLLEWDADAEGHERHDESVSEGLRPHEYLEKLEIRGFKGNSFPSWIPDVGHLTNIILSGCQRCKNIPKLGHLQHLKSLHLWKLCNVKLIDSSFYGTQSLGVDIFPALESIVLSYMPVLEEWEKGEFGNEVIVFPHLGSLKIYHCYKLECLPSWLFCKARNLKELDIRYCSMLRELPDGLHALNSLESITIKGCKDLESIPCPSRGGSLTSLATLEICDCRNLQAMVESTPMPRLEKVTMAGLKSLQNLPTFLDCLAESPLLELTVVGVPIRSSPTFKDWPFHRLQRLEMDVSREWSSERCKHIEGKVNWVLKSCSSSLGKLVLTGIESWEGLPKSIKELKSLNSLELENFGVVNLPEWFENLSSLTSLHLSNFTKLRRLPSLKAMQCLTKLKELHIHDCPELRIESERYKILKGASIHVDGHKI